MRELLAIALIFVAFPALCAEDPDSTIVSRINASGNISVEQPIGLGQRLEFDETEPSESAEKPGNKATSVGYRVEIFADNNPRTAKSQAMARRRNVSARMPEHATYMVFESPYWRVRVGDFRSRSEAESTLADIRRAFPAYSRDLRIVRSRIK